MDLKDESILYELLVYAEWDQEPEISKFPRSGSLTTISSQTVMKLLKNFTKSKVLTSDILRLLAKQLPWHFAVGENGKVVAILQETLLEIRTCRDEYSSVIGKASVPKDVFLQSRKMTWSPDCSMLAISFSTGVVSFYDLLGSNIFSIHPPYYNPDENSFHPLVSLLFLEPRIKSHRWSNEIVLIDYQGQLFNYLVSPTDGFQDNHTFSFESHYKAGVSSVAYHHLYKLLFVAGSTGLPNSEMLKDYGSSFGLSAWRFLNDCPYYKIVLSTDEEEAVQQAQRSVWNWVPTFRMKPKENIIVKMQISPQGNYLVCLHICGSISVWHLPSMRLYKLWNLREQPGYNTRNPQLLESWSKRKFKNTVNTDSDFNPIDINWWSESAVIIARYSGAVSVSSIKDLHNLLGDSPEFLAGQPQVSAVCSDRGFLSLECESTVSSFKRPAVSSMSLIEPESSDDEDDDNKESMFARTSTVIQSAIYMITDMERFQPKRKRPKLLHKTYRLLGLKSTTPEELYSRKIDNEEYGEALALAHAYNLDSDLVYQRQWRNSKVSVATIHDYLSKITKRSWVLRECIERVPETFAAAQELLEFGLKATNAEAFHCLNKEISESTGELFSSTHQLLDDSSNSALVIDFTNLNEEQIELLKFRQLLLSYLDKLHTYELILGGAHIAENLYDAAFYDKFRITNVFRSTIEFARDGNVQAVQHMFTYHGKDVLSHWMPILSNFPETLNPYKYQALLPECIIEGNIFHWPQNQLRENDWCEQADILSFIENNNEIGCDNFYSECPELKRYNCNCDDLSSDLVSEWYMYQAHQIESYGRMVDHALILIKLGRERNIMGLDTLLHQLTTLESLVYDVHLENITLNDMQSLSVLEQAKLLMSKTCEESFIDDTKHLLLPFLIRCEKQNVANKLHVLQGYLSYLSAQDLTLPVLFFEYVQTMENSTSVISSDIDLVNLVLECLYSYPHSDDLHKAQKIMECISKQLILSQSEPYLYDKITELESDLKAAQILSDNGVPKPLIYIHDCKANVEVVQPLFVKLARTLTRRIPSPSKSDWDKLLNDILTLQTRTFKGISKETCYEIFAETLLSSGCKETIYQAENVLGCSASNQIGKMVPYERSVKLILSASKEYFNSAGSLLDPAMELAKVCLHLIVDENEEIKEELDLISSLQILHDFGLSILPLHVRQSCDRLKIVESCIRKKPSAFRYCERLLNLAQKLNIAGKDYRQREGKVLILIADAAFEAADFEFCAKICQRIVSNNYAVGWEIVQKIGECNEFKQIDLRSEFLAFTLMHCSSIVIEQLVKSRCILEMEMLNKKLEEFLVDDAFSINLLENEDDDDEFSDALTSPMTPLKEFSGVSSIISTVKDTTDTITKTTRNFIKFVGNKSIWKKSLRWLDVGKNYANISEANPFKKQGFPAYYSSINYGCHESNFDTKYESFSPPDACDKAYFLCVCLFRIYMLADTSTQISQHDKNDALIQITERLLSEDCSLGIAHLLAVTNDEKVCLCFKNLPKTSISLQLAVYFYALVGYKMQLQLSKSDSFDKLYHFPPTKLIDYMSQKVKSGYFHDSWTEQFLFFEDLFCDQLEKEYLESLNCGIDMIRFFTDCQYRQDTILGLALSLEETQFQSTVILGKRHKMPIGQIAAVHAGALLLSASELGIPTLTLRLNNEELLHLLKTDPQIVLERLSQYVYPNVHGTDHQTLILYYNVLNSVTEEVVNKLLPQDHIKLLKKVRATSGDIDYKKLLEGPVSYLEVIQPLLKKDNIGLFSKLAKSLPPSLNYDLDIGNIYKSWLQAEFFKVLSSTNDEVWFNQYKFCRDYFSKLKPFDILDFAREICFSEKSVDLINVICRLDILRGIKTYCLEKTGIVGDGQVSDIWSEVIYSLDMWETHLELISKCALDFCNSREHQEILRAFDLTRSEAGPIRQFLRVAVVSSVDCETLNKLIKLFPPPILSLEQHLDNLLNEIIISMRNGIDAELADLLPAVLTRIQEAVEQCSPERTHDFTLWKQLEPLCGDENMTPSVRLQALQLLDKLQLVPNDSSHKMLHHHTQALVCTGWPQNNFSIKECDLLTEDLRATVLLKLLNHTTSWNQVQKLWEILNIWPAFENSQVRENYDPWIQFLRKTLTSKDVDANQMYTMLANIFNKATFLEENLRSLISELDEDIDATLLIFICLLSNNIELHHQAVIFIDNYSKNGQVKVYSHLIELLLQRKQFSSTVSTNIYQDIVEHLINENNEQDIEEVISQLTESGYVAEAGTLKMLSINIPPYLRNFSSALKILRYSSEK